MRSQMKTHNCEYRRYVSNYRSATGGSLTAVSVIWKSGLREKKIKNVVNTDTRCSVDGRKRYGNDKCGRKSFENGTKQESRPFSFQNGVVWTGSKKI